MLVVEGGEPFADRTVRDLPQLLRKGDVLVFNDTRVIPAQLEGRRGERADRRDAAQAARLAALAGVRPQRQATASRATRIDFAQGVSRHRRGARMSDGSFTLAFAGDEPVEVLLERAGTMPLPPYIAGKRATDEQDREDYQTLFAREDGAVAAPTAALHFTPELLAALDDAGIGRETLTLHVGAGTFLPVKADDTEAHVMHSEWGRIDAATAERLNAARGAGRASDRRRHHQSAPARKRGRRAWHDPPVRRRHGDLHHARLQVPRDRRADDQLPPAEIDAVHAGQRADGARAMQAAYAHAIAHEYRFYSYGDSSLLLP